MAGVTGGPWRAGAMLPKDRRIHVPRARAETGIRGGRPAGAGALRAPGAEGSGRQAGSAQRAGAPENVAGSGRVPRTGQVRIMPDSPAPPDAGIDAETAARLKKFKRLLEQRSAPETETMHWIAVQGNRALGRILKEMLETAPCDPSEMREKMDIGRGTYNAAQKRGRDRGLLERDSGKVALTRAGRLHALALRLGLSMSEMCVMSDFYVTWLALEDFDLQFYSKSIGITIRLGIADGYMDNICGGLVRKGCALRENPKSKGRKARRVLYMDGGLFARLHPFMEDLIWAQNSKWTFGKPRPAGLSLYAQSLAQYRDPDPEWQAFLAHGSWRRSAEKAGTPQSGRAPARDGSPPADPRP